MNHPRPLWIALVCAACTMLAACTSTPQHTNVLVFGTNTKLALDVSQDATSGVGVTLGYKRLEAVWMPLLPNQGTTTTAQGAMTTASLVPAQCDGTDCPKFVGVDSSGHADTYSVLASFGSKLGGGVNGTGTDAKVSAEIAQYFATGLAARLLAQHGGAGLVNTNANAPLSAKEQAEVARGAKGAQLELEEVLALLADKSDATKVDKTQVAKAFAKEPGSGIPPARQARIKTAESMPDLRRMLTGYDHSLVAVPMLKTLNTP